MVGMALARTTEHATPLVGVAAPPPGVVPAGARAACAGTPPGTSGTGVVGAVPGRSGGGGHLVTCLPLRAPVGF
ncbi:hypothetical protein ACIQVK_29980 [Streptomyces sp. NPDC090493]|uniref:hypothetical protein n=1 Tax=Streptomyces sp. NPDC090493 TaxID=3365964 RepID=UPI00381E3E48